MQAWTVSRVVHIRDWHYVALDAFAADVRETDADVTQAAIDQQYTEHLSTVERLQIEQLEYLRSLIKEHGVTAVYCEGVTAPTAEDFKALARSAVAWHDAYSALAEARRSNGIPDDAEFLQSIENVRRMMLQVGAAGQLYARGELRDILPLDDTDAHRASNPIGTDGSIQIDKAASPERHDAMVRNILEADGQVVVIILGGAHDLSDSLKRLTPEAKYERVTLKTYPTK